MSAADVLDIASFEQAATTATSGAGSEAAETPVIEGAEESTSEQSTEQSGGEKTTEGTTEGEQKDEKITPSKMRAALKAWKDANPENKAHAKELNDAIGRLEEYNKHFPSAKEAREFKTFVDGVGGMEGIRNLQSLSDNIAETDAMVHSGDPQIIANIVEDLKEAGKLDSLGKLMGPMIKATMENDPKGFDKAMRPYFAQSLSKYQVGQALEGIFQAFDAKDAKALEARLTHLGRWFNGVMSSANKKDEEPAADPEKQRLQKEIDSYKENDEKVFRSSLTDATTKSASTSVVSTLNKIFKANTYFKDFPVETKRALAKDIREAVWGHLNSQKTYSDSMKSLYKTRDAARIQKAHDDKFNESVEEVARKLLKNRYPGYDRSGPRTAATAAAKSSTATQTTGSNQAAYVPERPKTLIRDSVTYNGKTYDSNDLMTMQIAGKGFIREGTKLRFITWRKAL